MIRVLIVEDDLTLKMTYNILFAKEGYSVERAEDGEEAIRKATENEPDLILLDLLMPKVDGLEFLRRYDLKNKHPNVKVIVFTNISMPETIDEAMKLGATRYVTKAQNSPKELAQIVKEVLKSKIPATPQPAQPSAQPSNPPAPSNPEPNTSPPALSNP